MKKNLLLTLVALTGMHFVNAQTKTVTVDANDALNNNTKIVAQTSTGQIFFTGHQLGATYAYPSAGIFRAWTDNPTGASNIFFDGIAAGTTKFSVRADGQGYFAGNVGIGTTTPNGKLDIATSTASGQSDILQRYTWLGDLTNWGLRLEQQFNAPLSSIQYNWIMRKGTSTDIPVMSFAGGNVGINTTDNANWNLVNSPYKLAVNGSVIATSMTVKLNSAWPDYVFKKDYQLPSLQEVKAYIDQNQHLPEIPSEQQIAKDGLNLGEMNKLLMKKVEELTLYLIEKDQKEVQQAKINKMQEERIHKLEQQLDLLLNKSNN
ncbi:hypothetical protein [Mucilaginibacter sp. NFX135]|uniref:hypothetical protein n=1 Tax=Mucilaginibacter sp. NFX135 TaxID=3402687 RepID=UPI003AFA8B1B